jgi:hypothetical protein
MELERTTEQQISKETFPEISLISQDDWKKLREYILASSGGYDTEAIKEQLEFDFNPLYANEHQNVAASTGRTMSPNFIVENFHQENIQANISQLNLDIVSFWLFLDVIYDTDENITKKFDPKEVSFDENLATSLRDLFDQDPILTALFKELEIRGTSLTEKDLKAFERAILTERALLIAINYPQVF